MIEDCPFACIEIRKIFESAYCSFHSIHCTSTFFKH